jgi:hypothetical protein
MVKGREEVHPEGCYFFQIDGRWQRVSESAAEAQQEQRKRLARQRYRQETGETLPEPETKGVLLRRAIDEYLTGLELKVAAKNRQHRTFAMMKQTLNEFAGYSTVRYLHEVTAAHLDRYTAWVIGQSPTKSARTGWNKFLRVLQFLKHNDATPMVGIGKSIRPVGMRDAPRFVEKEVITNKPD